MRPLLLLIFMAALAIPSQAQTKHTINSGNFYYNPSSLTITEGDTVEWVNDGGFHNVNADVNTQTGLNFNNPESFISTATSNSVLLTRVFNVPGTYQYDCSVGAHAANGMVGTLIVDPGPVSVSEISQQTTTSFTAFQQANTNAIQVQFNMTEAAQNTAIHIYDLTGKRLVNQSINANKGDNQHTVNANTALTSGIYLVSLQFDGVTLTQKIFIEK
ncbi:MAG: plastocyanin/azurin family copper-binding protein [Salibacteraceae bacterium]